MTKAAEVVKSPIVGGALAGAGAGLSFYDAYRRFMDGDRSGAVISALGGTGALASMVPGLGLPGAAVGLASMPALYINDLLKEKTTAPGRDIEVDVMGNPTGR
jgi:methyl coenzyme M reductase beta subunit